MEPDRGMPKDDFPRNMDSLVGWRNIAAWKKGTFCLLLRVLSRERGMTLINHPLWFPLRESLGSFPHDSGQQGTFSTPSSLCFSHMARHRSQRVRDPHPPCCGKAHAMQQEPHPPFLSEQDWVVHVVLCQKPVAPVRVV